MFSKFFVTNFNNSKKTLHYFSDKLDFLFTLASETHMGFASLLLYSF